MRIASGLALATLLALPAAQAAADTPPPTEITFTDADTVRGDIAGGTVEVISVRENFGRSRLIRPRVSFVNELLKDAEDI
jgi:hypothetical protein